MDNDTHTGSDTERVTSHYTFGGLRTRIEAGLAQLDADPTVELLGPVDEFHVGGRPATKRVVDRLELTADDHVFDIGSGLGGTARFIASTTGASVTGIDLTDEYVDVAVWLTELVGLDSKVHFSHGSATDSDAESDTFTAATMCHVGMNIADKVALCREVARVLKPGGQFAIYDIMATSTTAASQLTYPVPWAAGPDTSHVATPKVYADALTTAGFDVTAVNDRSEAAIAALGQIAAAAKSGPPPLGLHLVMGAETPTKLANMAAAVTGGLIAPTEIFARVVK